jgi:hypothetical protein
VSAVASRIDRRRARGEERWDAEDAETRRVYVQADDHRDARVRGGTIRGNLRGPRSMALPTMAIILLLAVGSARVAAARSRWAS